MQQNTIKPKLGSKKKCKRIGRGNSAGKGTYCGRGVKGQNARTGGTRRPGFEGGQTPLLRKMPKLKGFTSPCKELFTVINVEKLNIFENDSKVDVNSLFEKRIIRSKKHQIKILGKGNLEKKLEVIAETFSSSAKEKIEKQGGKVVELKNPKKQ